MTSGCVEKDLEGHSVAKPSAWTYASQAQHRVCQKWVLENCEHLVHADISHHLWLIIQQLKTVSVLYLCDLWPRFLCLSFLKTVKCHWHQPENFPVSERKISDFLNWAKGQSTRVSKTWPWMADLQLEIQPFAFLL